MSRTNDSTKLRSASTGSIQNLTNMLAEREVQIRLIGGPSSHETQSPMRAPYSVVDVIDGAEEETFSFETFSSLLALSHSLHKDFIIARVTTADPSEENKFFYSYYLAHQMNKVLFRTQPEEGLLHRMKARNPLNNVLVVGDVHYYRISPEQVDNVIEMHSSVHRSKQVSSSQSVIDLSEVKGEATLDESAQLISGETEESIWKFDAEYYASDDDFLMKSTVREYFKQNAVSENDHVLFTLYSPEEHIVPIPDNLNGEQEIVRSWRNCFGILASRHYIKWFLFVYLLLGLVLVKFVIPSEYAYLVGFLLVFFLAFIVVFIIEFDV